MPEWLTDIYDNGTELDARVLAGQLALAFAFGCVVAAIYHFSKHPRTENGHSFLATLVLLSILIAMVTQVIGNSVARAFSLVGALSIVRFRTVVEDTRDTAFVIFAVVVGMAIGAGFLPIALVGIPVVALAAFAIRLRQFGSQAVIGEWVLAFRLGLGLAPESLLKEIFARYLDKTQLIGAATARQGAALDFTYQVRLRPGADAVGLVNELNQKEGVQSVELRPRQG